MNTEEWNPGNLLELSGYCWRTCTLHAGIKLDLFSVIDEAHLSAGEISK